MHRFPPSLAGGKRWAGSPVRTIRLNLGRNSNIASFFLGRRGLHQTPASLHKIPPFAAELRRRGIHRSPKSEQVTQTSRKTQGASAAAAAAATSSPSDDAAELTTRYQWHENLRGDAFYHILPNGGTSPHFYTGPIPSSSSSCPGYLPETGTITSLPLVNAGSATRSSLQRYFDNTWALTEVLFSGLAKEEAYYIPPVHGLRHPLVFYYGHVATLYINKLRVAGVLEDPINPYYEDIFETGVDEMSWDDMGKNDMIWPSIAEVRDYRKKAYDTVSNVIATYPGLDDSAGGYAITEDEPLWALVMGFEHERIHLETSSVLFRELPIDLVRPPAEWPKPHPSATVGKAWEHPEEGEHFPSNEMIPVPATTISLGKPRDFPSFGWDNEYGSRTVDVPTFKASRSLISNGEFYEFVSDGGYQNEDYWSEEGWGWRNHRNARAPFFWRKDGPNGLNQFKLRTIFEEIDMPMSWPAEVNYHEGKAFAAWKSEKEGKTHGSAYRLITEAEHNAIRSQNLRAPTVSEDASKDAVMSFSGNHMPFNLNFKHGSASPVDESPPSSTGHHDVFGNVWHWCEDDFNGLDGFRIHPYYTDFSTPCIDGRHNMILGGSFASTGDEASVFSRFHFRPHFLQHSGVRLVSSETPAPAVYIGNKGQDTETDNVYETEQSLHQYLLLHYGTAEETFDGAHHDGEITSALGFPQRCASILASTYKKHATSTDEGISRALDIGCAVGGATFELTSSFNEVVGLDFSQQFVDFSRKVQYDPDSVTYSTYTEAGVSSGTQCSVKLGDHLDVARASFRVGDACNLDAHALGGSFDAVLMANLLCRLPDPRACLKSLSQSGGLGIVKKGGIVMIVSPFSWMEDFTPKQNWLWNEDSEFTGSSESLQAELEPNFELVDKQPLPLIIRDHRRKWQYIVPEAALYKRVL